MFSRSSKHFVLNHFARSTRRTFSTSSTSRFPGVESTESVRKVIFSGIQPTGVPHVSQIFLRVPRFLSLYAQLGNYLGALSNWVKLQRNATPEDDLFFSIVGWHALTLPQDPTTLAASRSDLLATLLAIGIDPKRSVVFHQDHVSTG